MWHNPANLLIPSGRNWVVQQLLVIIVYLIPFVALARPSNQIAGASERTEMHPVMHSENVVIRQTSVNNDQ